MRRYGKTGIGVLRGIMRPYAGKVIFLCVLTVLLSALQISFALVTSKLVNVALQDPGALPLWVGLMAANLLGIIALHGLQSWLSGSVMDCSMAGLRHELLKAAVHSEGERLHEYHSGALLNRGMEDVRALCDGTVSALPAMVGQVTRLVGSFAAVIILYRPIAGLIALAVLAVAATVAWLRPILKRQYIRVRQGEERAMSAMQEDLQQLELIRSLGAEEQILNRFDGHQRVSLESKTQRRRWLVGYSSMMTGVTQVGTGILLLWGAGQVALGALSYGALTAMIQLMSLLRGPVVGLSGLWTRLASVEVAEERLLELMRGPQTEEHTAVEDVRAVVFEDVTFTYPGDEVPVLEHYSAEFTMDPWVCMTGMSGKGKSTLFKLMLGLYTPQQGRIYLETAEGQVPCGAWTRSVFAYVPQDFALFSGTVRENLLLVAPDATDEERKKAIHLAQADFIWEMAAGEDAPVLENNGGLSKGQLQRLAVARALLMDRPILLLDECTSALDAPTEEALLQALYGLGKQAILVTHRPEAIDRLPQVRRARLEDMK